jgi:hypothetical protein
MKIYKFHDFVINEEKRTQDKEVQFYSNSVFEEENTDSDMNIANYEFEGKVYDFTKLVKRVGLPV